MRTGGSIEKRRGPAWPAALLAIAALMALAAGPAGSLTIDLKRADRMVLDDGWAFTSLSWHAGKAGLRDTGSARSHAVLLRELDAAHPWAEAELTVAGRAGDGWAVAGVSLYQDVRNYWHLALVEAPASMGGGRSVELRRMKDGEWGSEIKDPGASKIRSEGAGFSWQQDQRYRLRLETDGRVIIGRVWDARRRKVAEIAYSLGAGLAEAHYPAVDNQCLATTFQKLGYSASGRGQVIGKRPHYEVVQDSGRFWLKGPGGGKGLSIGCELVKYREIWCQALGYSPYLRNSERLFGSESAWAADVAGKLNDWGFNTVGQSDRNEEISKQGLAYAPILRLGQGFSDIAAIVPKTFWTGFPDVFDPGFERYCRAAAETQCRPWRDDPRLLGYYIDNELEWFGKDYKPWALFTSAMRLGPESPAKRAAVECLRKRYPAISEFNRAWGCSASTWDLLDAPCRLPDPMTREAMGDAGGFVRLCAERYFKIASDAIRRADPNHLVLGSRFAWVAQEPAWREAGKHCDVVSFNCYPRVEMLSGEVPGLRDTLIHRYAVCGRPMIVSEWGFPALDAGLPSTRGAGMRVDDQYQRAYCAARVQEELLALPFMVGTSWFMWADEPALGVSDSFPENSNYGLVDVRHRPYLGVASALASVHRKANAIHAGQSFRSTADSLREGLAARYGAGARGPRPSVRMRSGRLVIDNGTVRLVLTPGKSVGLDSIFWRGIPMGGYHPLLWQRRKGDGWLRPDRITGFEFGNAAGNGLALMFRADYAPADTSWCRFSLSFRITVPPEGSFILVEADEIKNLDQRPWELQGYYHYIPSWLGGDADGDIPLVPQVPNYWLERGGWFDQALGLHYGALALDEGRWSLRPYIDSLGIRHPDIYRHLGRSIEPMGSVSEAGPPIVLYMGRDDPGSQPWTRSAFQAWSWMAERKAGQQNP